MGIAQQAGIAPLLNIAAATPHLHRVAGHTAGVAAGAELEKGRHDADKTRSERLIESLTEPGLQQQILVLAKFSDGTSSDVTDDSRYSSSNENTARVDEAGLVHSFNKGEAAIMARYGDKMAVSNLVVMNRDAQFAWSQPPANNYIDQLVNAKLKQMEILPSELSSDEQFLRRVYYDVIGLPQTPEDRESPFAILRKWDKTP